MKNEVNILKTITMEFDNDSITIDLCDYGDNYYEIWSEGNVSEPFRHGKTFTLDRAKMIFANTVKTINAYRK